MTKFDKFFLSVRGRRLYIFGLRKSLNSLARGPQLFGLRDFRATIRHVMKGTVL